MALPTASDNIFPKLILDEGGTLGSVTAGERRLGIDANGILVWKNSAGTTSPLVALNKWDGTTAPAVTDDSGDGYAVGSRWIDTTNDKEYVCLDASVGAAVWTETTTAGGGAVATDAIWDAAGDLPVGSGANTAAKLPIGATGERLTVVGGTAAWAVPSLLQQSTVRRTAGNVNVASTSFIDVTGMSITITTGARRCLVIAQISMAGSADADTCRTTLDIDGTNVGGATGGLAQETASGASHYNNMSFTYLTDVLTAASHTFKIRARNGFGTASVAGGDPPCILTVIETAFTT